MSSAVKTEKRIKEGPTAGVLSGGEKSLHGEGEGNGKTACL